MITLYVTEIARQLHEKEDAHVGIVVRNDVSTFHGHVPLWIDGQVQHLYARHGLIIIEEQLDPTYVKQLFHRLLQKPMNVELAMEVCA